MSLAAAPLTVLAIMAGTLFPMQTAINARLASHVGGPIAATFVSFVVGLAALTALMLATTRRLPDMQDLGTLPWWLFVAGGLLGASYLCLNVLLIPRIGAGAMAALAIAGQMSAAIALDRFGAFGLAFRELTPGRLMGAILVIAGALMVRLL